MLKKFILKTIAVTVSFFAIYILIAEAIFYIFPEKMFDIFQQDWIRIQKRIIDSNKKINQDTLYVGCSVAGQFFPHTHTQTNQLTTNASTYPIGNYFLIEKAIKKNKNIKTVIYISAPQVVSHKLSRERTHSYFVKPFYTLENRKKIQASKTVNQLLKRNPFLPLCLFNSYKLLKIDDFNYSDNKIKSGEILSEESIEWIKEIQNLCSKNEINFHLLSPPLPQSKKAETLAWNKMKKQVKGTELEDLFQHYFNSIIYLDDTHSDDGLHWNDDFLTKNRNQLKKEILSKTKAEK